MTVHLDYDEPVLGYHRIVAQLVADHAPLGSAMADFGCGPGQVLREVHQRRPDLRLHGIDGDDECLRRAAQRCPTATLVRADLENFEEPGEGHEPVEERQRFSTIVSSHSLEHVADPVATLRHWAGHLTPGGSLILAVPNALAPPLLARALLRRPWANEGHYYIWDRPTFQNFCRLAGFRVVVSISDSVPLVPVRIREKLPFISTVEQLLTRAVPLLSNSHIVVLAPDA